MLNLRKWTPTGTAFGAQHPQRSRKTAIEAVTKQTPQKNNEKHAKAEALHLANQAFRPTEFYFLSYATSATQSTK